MSAKLIVPFFCTAACARRRDPHVLMCAPAATAAQVAYVTNSRLVIRSRLVSMSPPSAANFFAAL